MWSLISMEASARFLNLSLTRHLKRHALPPKLPFYHLHARRIQASSSTHFLSPRKPVRPFSSHFLSSSFNCPRYSSNKFHDSQPNISDQSIPILDSSNEENRGFWNGKGSNVTVVLLGWLGAEERHLRKYAEMYNAKGLRTVRFVVPLKETVGFDLCKNVEEKIDGLGKELIDWCLDGNEERYLIFHTFSNTGWLTYGVLLQNFQSRNDIIEKIRGCVVDSAPSAEIDPRIWAAGYCAAILKKHSSSTATKPANGTKLNEKTTNTQDIIPSLIEVVVFKILEIFFSLVLSLPYANKRLSGIISTLKDQPPCPQLYLYSSGDKVIPADVVESFIKQQKAMGRLVFSHNFGSSPHVDHFRSFPKLYTEKVTEFLKECFPTSVAIGRRIFKTDSLSGLDEVINKFDSSVIFSTTMTLPCFHGSNTKSTYVVGFTHHL